MQNTLKIEKGLILLILISLYPVGFLFKVHTFVWYPAIFCFLLICFLNTFKNGELLIKNINYSYSFYLIFCAFIFSSLWSIVPLWTLYRAVVLLFFVGLFYFSNSLFIHNQRKWFFQLVIYLPIIILICNVYIYLKFGSVRINSQAMRESVSSFSNIGTAIVILCVPFIIYLFITNKLNKLKIYGCLLCAIVSIVFAQSRAGYLLFGLIILLFFVFLKKKIIRIILKHSIQIGVISILFFPIIISILSSNNISRYQEKFWYKIQTSSMFSPNAYVNPEEGIADYARIIMIHECFNIIMEKPLTGIGYEGFLTYTKKKLGYELFSHNIILTMWGEGGFFAMLFFMLSTVTAFKRLSQYKKMFKKYNFDEYCFYTATTIALIIALIHSLIRPQLKNPMFYIVFAIALSLKPLGKIKISKGVSNFGSHIENYYQRHPESVR